MDGESANDGCISGSYNGYDYYVVRNAFQAWVAYIDVTDAGALHFIDMGEADSYGLPFHGGCTFCGKAHGTAPAALMGVGENRYMLGCDWCHGMDYSRFGTYGVEDVRSDEVIENLIAVIRCFPSVILKREIEGKFGDGVW